MNMKYERSALGMILAFLLGPIIPVTLIWYLITPTGFWQMFAMTIFGVILYFVFLCIEIILIALLS